MKNFFLCLIALFVTTQSFAQIEPGKAFKKAKSALVAYNTSPQDNGDKLKEAVEMIGIAVTGEEEKALSKTWALNAEILNKKSVHMTASQYKGKYLSGAS